MDKPKPKIKNLKSKIIFFGILLFLFFAYVFPFLMPNGTEKYSGVKKEAAESALAFANSVNGNNFPNPLTFRVEDVYPASADDCSKSLYYSPDPNNIRYYAVSVSDFWLFGIKMGNSNMPVCRTEGISLE